MLPFKDAGGLLQYEWLRQNYGAYTTELKAYKAKGLNGEHVQHNYCQWEPIFFNISSIEVVAILRMTLSTENYINVCFQY